MSRGRSATLSLLALCLTLPVHAAGPEVGEELHYRWRLTKFLGLIASLFLPHEGDGLLSLRAHGPDSLLSELKITSEDTESGDFFLYGSELVKSTGRTVHAWSSYSWRGEKNSKQGEIAGAGVVDIASGIFLLRQDPPSKPRPMEIWSDGKIYPVVVIPLGIERREIGDREITTRHLSIRAAAKPGQRVWKGKLDLWLADDAAATPVEILIDRRSAGVRLELVGR